MPVVPFGLLTQVIFPFAFVRLSPVHPLALTILVVHHLLRVAVSGWALFAVRVFTPELARRPQVL
jgi:hypothetical protein